jgi:hypothetical protein
MTAFDTGERKIEILNLKRSQLHLKEGYIELAPQDTKTDEGRSINLTKRTIATLGALFATFQHRTRSAFDRYYIVDDSDQLAAVAKDEAGISGHVLDTRPIQDEIQKLESPQFPASAPPRPRHTDPRVDSRSFVWTSPATLDREVELLKRMLNYVVTCKKLPSNPGPSVWARFGHAFRPSGPSGCYLEKGGKSTSK